MTTLGLCGRQLGVLVIWRAVVMPGGGGWFVGKELNEKSVLGDLPVGRELCDLLRIGSR